MAETNESNVRERSRFVEFVRSKWGMIGGRGSRATHTGICRYRSSFTANSEKICFDCGLLISTIHISERQVMQVMQDITYQCQGGTKQQTDPASQLPQIPITWSRQSYCCYTRSGPARTLEGRRYFLRCSRGGKHWIYVLVRGDARRESCL